MSLFLYEFKKKKVRKERIRDGKKEVVWVWQYEDVPDGYKVLDGKLVKMSQKERQNRRKASKKSANKSSTKRNRQISLKRRKSLIRN